MTLAVTTDQNIACCTRFRLIAHGAVQGVGFRPTVFRLATEMALGGWVINSGEGVIIEIEGPDDIVPQFSIRLRSELPPLANIQSLESNEIPVVGEDTFEIHESLDCVPTTLIVPDIATCEECRRDVLDPDNRRFRYPFTNCTNCGPRYSIIEALPYDRPNTSMSAFTMCPACEAEYRDPHNRRFHAQPNACAVCGPQIAYQTVRDAAALHGESALTAAVAAIDSGDVIAVKGLGGFHLVVDATNAKAVESLRRRKNREDKPLAMMYPSIDQVMCDCIVTDVERRQLECPEAPIVLLRRHPGPTPIADAVAPDSPWFGVMLPYTPLHHLLLAELDRPIVATSGNLTDETICIDNDEAAKRLGHIADGFLTHDRPIVRHVDDSIVAFVADQPAIMRRARGFAPLPIHLSRTLPAILAVGPHMKNTVAIAVEDNVFVSQHIGDLDTLPSRETFVQTINAFKELYRFEPEVIACDLHPDYASTHYAIDSGLPVVQVQHHYSHALSCMAEHDLHGDVLAVVWDGTGWGPDGTIWGGEFLTVNDAGYERAAAFRSFPLPGGDAAVREPRRSALGAIYEASGAAGLEESAAIDAFSDVELKVLTSALRTQTNSPRTSSAGRLFDTVAALTGICCRSTFEGQAAMQLEFAIDQDAAVAPFDYSIREHSDTVAYAPELTVDWFPILQNIICELRSQTVPAVIAARFHRTLIDIIVDVAGRLSYDRVVLSGGCFQNRWLIEHAIVRLRRVGITPYWHRQVPPNDGGVALGQIIAAAREI